jgi:hypothetical protein
VHSLHLEHCAEEIGLAGFRARRGKANCEELVTKLWVDCPNEISSPDCPVLRLTLLCFGAAKDLPEAAKMVTSGTACHAGVQLTAGLSLLFKPGYDRRTNEMS